MSPSKAQNMLVPVVLFHVAIVLLHGAAHIFLHIDLTSAENLYSIVVIVLAPLVAAGLLWTRFWRGAAYLLAICMIGSLAFGGYKHFLSGTNDDVSHMSHAGWGGIFLATSILLFVVEAAGIVLALKAAVVGKNQTAAS